MNTKQNDFISTLLEQFPEKKTIRFQDNSMFRVVKDWSEGPTNQTIPPSIPVIQ
jgi:hypothetical protein